MCTYITPASIHTHVIYTKCRSRDDDNVYDVDDVDDVDDVRDVDDVCC